MMVGILVHSWLVLQVHMEPEPSSTSGVRRQVWLMVFVVIGMSPPTLISLRSRIVSGNSFQSGNGTLGTLFVADKMAESNRSRPSWNIKRNIVMCPNLSRCVPMCPNVSPSRARTGLRNAEVLQQQPPLLSHSLQTLSITSDCVGIIMLTLPLNRVAAPGAPGQYTILIIMPLLSPPCTTYNGQVSMFIIRCVIINYT